MPRFRIHRPAPSHVLVACESCGGISGRLSNDMAVSRWKAAHKCQRPPEASTKGPGSDARHETTPTPTQRANERERAI